jgi:hypothetical protein
MKKRLLRFRFSEQPRLLQPVKCLFAGFSDVDQVDMHIKDLQASGLLGKFGNTQPIHKRHRQGSRAPD